MVIFVTTRLSIYIHTYILSCILELYQMQSYIEHHTSAKRVIVDHDESAHSAETS